MSGLLLTLCQHVAWASVRPPVAIADTTFTVNSEDDVDDGACDAGHCSLREAILAANSRFGTDTLHFDIAGLAPHLIQPTSPLPTLVDPAVIDGTSAPDFGGTLVIILDGANAGTAADGLRIAAGASTVRGLVIQGFATGVRLESNGGNLLELNIVGADFRALSCRGNRGAGIWIAAPDNVIGGSVFGVGNIIGCNGAAGIRIEGASGNVLLGNFIGTDKGRQASLPNAGDGVQIVGGAANSVGGTGALDGNYIASNGGSGVSLSGGAATGNRVIGNTITGNLADGISLPDAGSGNRVSGNSIAANGGLGIDLGAPGITANDAGDGDSGPNNLQNFPILRSALPLPGKIVVAGALNSLANTGFELELFRSGSCDPAGHGEGEDVLPGTSVSTDGSGDASFSAEVTDFFLPGDIITATATHPDGSTSEFSACLPVTDFRVSVSPDSVIVGGGASASYFVDIESLGGSFTEPIVLGCTDLPSFATCSFSPDTIVPVAGSARSILKLVIAASSSASAVTRQARSARAAPPFAPAAPLVPLYALTSALLLIGLGSVSVRARLRTESRVLLLAIALGGIALLASCGGDDGTGPPDNGIPSGRFEFSVVATSGPLSHSDAAMLIVN